MSERLDLAKVLSEQLSGTGIRLEDIIEAKKIVDKDYDKWDNDDIKIVLQDLLRRAKPMLIVANKADLPSSEINIRRLEEKYGKVIPASAESELALIRASEAGLIKYFPGDNDFEIIEPEKLNPNQIKALNYIKEHVLQKYGSTGVQRALNEAVFDVLDMIVVFPVEDEHKLSDQKGNVLPDALLIKNGSKPRNMAYVIHTDIGDTFMHAIDARSCRRISSDYEIKNGDIISIICR